jgi:hypothetical protein
VLSPDHPPYLPDEADGVTAVKLLNDAYAELAHRHPRPHQLLRDAAVAAYRREPEGDGARLRQLGCVGVNMNIVLPRPLGRRDRVRADLRRDEPPRRRSSSSTRPAAASARRFINDYNYRAAVGTSLEDATFVLHMIAKQIPYRYPNIKFIVPHLGGPIPMLLNRLDKQGQRPATTLTSPRRRASPRRNSITHMWTAPSSQGVLQFLIRSLASICPACLVRSHMNAGQDGFRDGSSKQGSDLVEGHWIASECLPSSDRSITPSAHSLASSGIGSARLQLSCSPCLADL